MKRIIRILSCVVLMFIMFTLLGGMKVHASDSNFHLITTNPGENASTSININYHCYKTGSHIEYTLVSDENFANATSITPSEVLWDIKNEKNADPNDTFYTVSRYVCSASLTNLTPCTKYKYRLVLGNEISDTYYFTTAGLTNDWNFLAFADFQYGKNKVSHKLIKSMEAIGNDPALVVCSGDMSDVTGSEEEWTWFLDNPVMQDFIYATAPGDHEYWAQYIKFADGGHETKLFTSPCIYNHVFNNPKNGAQLSLNSNYYFYYNNVLFVMIDTDDSDTASSTKISQQVTWFKNTIKELAGTYQYLVVLGHKSIYSAYSNDSSVHSKLCPQWYPVFDQFGVDLVISGHDHMYSRTKKLYGGKVITNAGEDRYRGTYYLDLGSSGDKTRALEQKILTDGLHVNGPDIDALGYSLGANIEVSKTDMLVTIYNQNGLVVDEFKILAKRDPLAVDMSGFDQEALLNDAKMTIDSFSTQRGSLSFTSGEMLKYVTNVKITSGDTTCLDTKVSYNSKSHTYDVENMDKVSYEIVFTLNDGNTVTKEFKCDYWGSSGVKLKKGTKLSLTWSSAISSFSDYTWKVYMDNNLIKTLSTNDLMMGSLYIPNQYLVGNHELKIELMLGEEVADTYTAPFNGASELVLSKDEVTIGVGETINLDYDFEYEDLVKITVSDPTIVSYENGVLKGLKKGETEVIFTIKDCDLTYKCKVNVEAKGGCNSSSAAELISLFSFLALAIAIRRKH